MRRLSFVLLILPALLFAQESRLIQYSASNQDLHQALSQSPWTLMNVSDNLMASIARKFSGEIPEENFKVKRINPEIPIEFHIKTGTGEDRYRLFIDSEDYKFEYWLVDLRYKTVLREIIFSNQKQIDFSRFKPGTYFLQVDRHITHEILIGG